MKKKVLVCGATGFIGRNIAEGLVRRDDLEVIAVSHKRPAFDLPGLKWVEADLTSAADIERILPGIDVIIQAAATTSGSKDIVSRPYIHVTDNAVMNSLLLRSAHDNKVKHFIFFSCTVMYQSGDKPLVEDDFNANEEIFHKYFGVGWTKVYIERMSEFYAQLGSLRTTVIRHSNIYGPHDKFDLERSHVFGATITKVLSAKDRKVIVWGTGEEARDLLYVGDLVDFVERAMDRQQTPFELFNCGVGKAVAIKELVHRIVAASGMDLKIEHDLSQPTIPTSLCLDCGKAERLLGWSPQMPLDQGIKTTIDWWRTHVAPLMTVSS